MSDKLSIEEENQILIDRLVRLAGYDLERDKKKAEDENKMAVLSPVQLLHLVLKRVNQEATT